MKHLSKMLVVGFQMIKASVVVVKGLTHLISLGTSMAM